MTNLIPKIQYGHQTAAAAYYPVQCDQTEQQYEEVYYGQTSSCKANVPFVRVVKRRTTANKKERRRTQSINSAFAYLRDCIPNVPSDTKLSKVCIDRCAVEIHSRAIHWSHLCLQIKTLRLATSYINYLNGVLEGDQDPTGGFRAELVPSSRKINAERRAKSEAQVRIPLFFFSAAKPPTRSRCCIFRLIN